MIKWRISNQNTAILFNRRLNLASFVMDNQTLYIHKQILNHIRTHTHSTHERHVRGAAAATENKIVSTILKIRLEMFSNQHIIYQYSIGTCVAVCDGVYNCWRRVVCCQLDKITLIKRIHDSAVSRINHMHTEFVVFFLSLSLLR